ncbi:MAG: class I SAM-dependent methyltransferase [Nitriliruptorales bacterium]|nr:class I SAM-dependent methyltransferase [Nitriliruptorales bacterium]
MAAQATIDEGRVEEFGGRLVGILDDANTALFLSVGHQTGLFDTMAGLEPSTSTEIARAAVLDERYVREWLGGMTVAGIVEYDPATNTYTLPPEHAALTTSDAGPDNMAFFMQYIGMLASVESEIVRVFREGGGVPYSAFDTFQGIQREETARVYDVALVDTILPLSSGLVELLERGVDVVDIGCGGGHAVNVMARAFPNSRFVGLDISEEGIGFGRAEAEEWGLTNARFEVGDAAELSGSWDVITAFDTIHDQAQPTKVLQAVAGALKDDGIFLMGDIAFSSNLEDNIGNPFAATVFGFSLFHCMTVSLAYGGEALGTAWGEQLALSILSHAAYTNVTTPQVDDDPLNIYYPARLA